MNRGFASPWDGGVSILECTFSCCCDGVPPLPSVSVSSDLTIYVSGLKTKGSILILSEF
jgi:hypothetical protein